MRKKKAGKARGERGGQSTESSLLSKMTRLLEVLVRLNLQAMRNDRGQKEMVLMLDAMGYGHAEIAGLLGITPNSVGPTLSRARSRR